MGLYLQLGVHFWYKYIFVYLQNEFVLYSHKCNLTQNVHLVG